MTDERYQQLMRDVGMPNSRSLLQALQQVANEVWQQCAASGFANDVGKYLEMTNDIPTWKRPARRKAL